MPKDQNSIIINLEVESILQKGMVFHKSFDWQRKKASKLGLSWWWTEVFDLERNIVTVSVSKLVKEIQMRYTAVFFSGYGCRLERIT